MLKKLRSAVSRNLNNALGWRTDRKIIVFESDDWGSIRMPNKNTYNKLLRKGIRVDLCPYNKYDTLANSQDFEALFNTLIKHSDYKGNHPIITLNANVVNPDFDKIKLNNYKQYYHEYFTETLKKYYPKENVFSMWNEGINKKLIFPQFHGREHVNSEIWLDLIRNGNVPLKQACEFNLYGLSFITSQMIKVPFLASLIYSSDKQRAAVETSIEEGSEIFKQIFGFKSKSFIAPLYTWDPKLESVLSQAGVKYIQGSDRHKEYNFLTNKFKRNHHIMGGVNQFEQIYLHRNCTFEPTILSNRTNIKNCLKQIETAFFWKKPAVISMHRLNLIGSLEENNRNKNLIELDILLTQIKQRWKNVEFMHSSQLGDLIEKEYNDL